jgi:hypothetical protein
MSTLALVPRPSLEELATMAVAAVPSPISRMSYKGYLKRFLDWSRGRSLSRDTVAAFISELRDSGASASVLRQAIKSIRVLAHEARIRHLISEIEYKAVLDLKQSMPRGNRKMSRRSSGFLNAIP